MDEISPSWIENYPSPSWIEKLCERVRSIERVDTNMRLCIPFHKRVAIALFALGSAAEYRTVASLFGVGRSTVGEIVMHFCHAVCEKLRYRLQHPCCLNLESSKDYFKRRVEYVQEQIEKIEKIQLQKSRFLSAVISVTEMKQIAAAKQMQQQAV